MKQLFISNNLKIIYFVILIGAIQGLLLSMVILTKRFGDLRLKRLLGFSLLLLSIRITLYPFVGFTGPSILEGFKHISFLSLLLIGPLLYLYFLIRIKGERRIRFWDFLHTLPFLFYLVHVLINPLIFSLGYCYAPLFSSFIYGVISTHLVYKSRRSDKTQKGMLGFAIMLFIIPVLILIFSHLNKSLIFGFSEQPALIPYILITIAIYIFGFRALKNPKMYLDKLLKVPVKQNQSINQNDVINLLELIENNQLFLDPNFSIKRLVELTGLSRHKISFLINKGMEKTFNQVVNEYRIKTAQQMLLDPKMDNLTIQGIALDSGYNSKVTFLKYFKKYTKLKPSEFKRKFRI